jgi:hypothetical protein
LDNLYVAAVSISQESFILLSRTFNRETEIPDHSIRWVSIGEIGNQQKPIWINMLQNAADLILKAEEEASFIMLQIALDFYYDALIEQVGLIRRDIKAATRRWKISDRRAKIRLLEQRFGSFPTEMTQKLVDIAELRNRIVHGTIENKDAKELSGSEAFKIIVESIITINDYKYAYFKKEKITPRAF